MKNTRHEESFMPDGKVGSSKWIEQFLHYSRNRPETETKEILFQAMNTDSLTQVLSRGGIDHIVEEIEQAQTPTGVLFFDLMGFKEVNDFRGHATGDKVLAYTADKLAEAFRTSKDRRLGQTQITSEERKEDRRNYALDEDIIFRKLIENSKLGRYGGDEFMVLLPRVQTYKALENIGFRVAHTMNLDSKCQPSSIGGALYLGNDNSMTETIQDADQAMYASKRALRTDEAQRELDRPESGFAIRNEDKSFDIYLPEAIKARLSE